MTELDIFTAPHKNSRYWNASTVTWEEIIGWMSEPADVKAAGNYVLGRFEGKRRTKATVKDRCALTLDVDHPESGFLVDALMEIDSMAVIHTTFSSEPGAERYRIIMPLSRRVSPEEYAHAAAAMMQRLGEAQFDPGSVQAERYMFKPGTQDPDWFHYEVIDGDPLDPAPLLKDFQPEQTSIPIPKPSRSKRNPFELEGAVGMFNRVYQDLDELIDAYSLPYEHEAADRYRLVGASGAAGMGPIEDAEGLFYSHHSNDPAYGVTCSAFDLVRLHRFAEDDTSEDLKKPVNRRPSHERMLELAAADPRVLNESLGADFIQDMQDIVGEVEPDNWRTQLIMNSRTLKMKDDVRNWDLIKMNDPAAKAIFRNELTLATEIMTDLPWRKLEPRRETFTDGDRAEFGFHLERTYGIRPPRAIVDDIIRTLAERNPRNPVRDYLLGLKWDGRPRLETCLPGVEDTAYTRLVARKVITAAAARMLEPGIKWDHMLVIYGKEGLGKTFWIDKMAKGHSASLGRIGDKDTLLTLQRSWIVTSDEGHSLRKADFDAQKEFLTRTEDVFRLPYERETQAHKRHCVIWGTTNDETFLRRQEGNRRFLIVRAERKLDFDQWTDGHVDQIWAEAVHLFQNGERLFLTEEEAQMAELEREAFIEEDAQEGLIKQYLETKLPMDWHQKSLEDRQLWFMNRDNGFTPEGEIKLNRVCSLQLWVEALGQEVGRHRRIDLLEITNVMKRQANWVQLPGRHRVPGYGPQMVFERQSDFTDDLEELL